MISVAQNLKQHGFARLPVCPALRSWCDALLPRARALAADPEHRKKWLRHGGTWFAGVNTLDNDPTGRVGPGPPLPDEMFALLTGLGLPTHLDRGQLSVVYPGYPRQDPGESATAHRFRRDRDAAHVDGLLPIGPDRRRMLREPHAYVLGIPLTATNAGASPLVVWRGSHALIREGLTAVLGQKPVLNWEDVDLTDCYHATRRRIFAECERVQVAAKPGDAYLVHRLALHGVAPWRRAAQAPAEGRMIAYFRPECASPEDWLRAP